MPTYTLSLQYQIEAPTPAEALTKAISGEVQPNAVGGIREMPVRPQPQQVKQNATLPAPGTNA